MRFAKADPLEDEELQTIYDEMASLGLGDEEPYSFWTALSQRPDLLRSMWSFFRALIGGGRLPGSIKQIILLAISAQNDCQYCSVAHAHKLEEMGVPESVIAACKSDIDEIELPPPQRALVQFGLKAGAKSGEVTRDDLEHLRDLGLNEGEIIEATMLAAFANLINTWADVSGIEPDH